MHGIWFIVIKLLLLIVRMSLMLVQFINNSFFELVITAVLFFVVLKFGDKDDVDK